MNVLSRLREFFKPKCALCKERILEKDFIEIPFSKNYHWKCFRQKLEESRGE